MVYLVLFMALKYMILGYLIWIIFVFYLIMFKYVQVKYSKYMHNKCISNQNVAKYGSKLITYKRTDTFYQMKSKEKSYQDEKPLI